MRIGAAFRVTMALVLALASGAPAASVEQETQLTLEPDDVIPTGNDWIALPSIRAGDAALMDFNVISMRYRGLIEFAGAPGQPLMKPFLSVAGVKKPLANLRWSERDYWLPTGTMEADGLRTRITFVAPPDSRAAIIRFQVTNLGSAPVKAAPGMDVDWARTNRVTYSPEPLAGARTMSPTPIDTDMEIFNYKTDDTKFAWGFAYVGSHGALRDEDGNPGVTAEHEATLAPGQAVFLPAGGLHAYLHGTGVELLANSDNVVRAGLTSKHIDVAELLKLTDPAVAVPVIEPRPSGGGIFRYDSPAPEFRLYRAELGAGEVTLPGASGARVVLCTEGTAALRAESGALKVAKGESCFLAAADGAVTASGPATLFIAGPGITG